MSLNLKLIGAAVLISGAMGVASAAQAAPAAPASGLAGTGLIEHVAQGCGPGYARGPRGFCRPMRGGYGPGPGFGPRRCFVRPTPWGPRRVCR